MEYLQPGFFTVTGAANSLHGSSMTANSFGSPIGKGNIMLWDLYNITPMNPVLTETELTGQQIIEMLEENLERTFSANPFKQMGGYAKRCSGLQLKIRIENPAGHRIQEIYLGNSRLIKNKYYRVVYITEQAVPDKYIISQRALTTIYLSIITALRLPNCKKLKNKIITFRKYYVIS